MKPGKIRKSLKDKNAKQMIKTESLRSKNVTTLHYDNGSTERVQINLCRQLQIVI